MKKLLILLFLFFVCGQAFAQCYMRARDNVQVFNLEDPTTRWKYGTWLIWDVSVGSGGTNTARYDARAFLQENLHFYIDADDQYAASAVCPILNEAVKFDYEEFPGAADHAGIYGVTSADVVNCSQCAVSFPDITPRYIPTPSATIDGADVDLAWSAPDVEVPGDVVGYKVYRSTNGYTLTYLADEPTEAYTDLAPPAGTYYYCIRLKYRSAGTISSAYCSRNSNGVTIP